ncbi:hypothetical protein [Nonomuraea sp. LPB2021202275-12-8]|uniref:hypothetical protein n=1 Tax=Nonomuraea sp. LPB2021202275-12-8 TaxID=3120159 RepID=UPI00300C41A7
MAAVLEAWAGQGLTISDRRSRMLFVAGEGPDVIAYYAAIGGLAKRWIEVEVKGVPLDLQQTYDEGRGLADAGRPAEHLEWAQVGGEDPGFLPHAAFEAGTRLSPKAVSMIRYADRLRMVPPGRVKPALLCFALVAGIRETNRERFPFLSTGREPAPTGKNSPDQGIDLHSIRQRISSHRKLRVPSAYEIVKPDTDLANYQKLAQANATPIESVLLRLGCSATDDDPAWWNCPRPGGHRNRDARPSLRIRKNEARCGICDKGPLPPAQLVADTLKITPDEAASFIVDLKCATDRPALGYRRPELVAPPRRDTLVTAYISASKPDRFDCVIYDAGIGYRREAVIWRPDTANLPEGVVPLQLRRGDVVTALTVEFQPATAGKAGYWQLSITAPKLAVRALASRVQEIIDGRVVVKDVERVMGARTKVVVAPTELGMDAVGACIGHKGSRLDAAHRLVNMPARGERLEIIPYSSDRQTYLVHAMHPAEAIDVRIRGGNAIVAVSPQQFHNGVGEGGLNAQLAGKLTGLYVEVVTSGTDLDAALTSLEERRKRLREPTGADDRHDAADHR